MSVRCSGCRDGAALPFDIAMAFQPIVDLETRGVFAYEALVRGVEGQPAGEVLTQVDEANRYAFDQRCRVRAIETASALKLTASDARLSINFLPNAVYEPRACIRLTLEAAVAAALPTHRIIFEFTEHETVDPAHLTNILRCYQAMGFLTAIDDFGAGHSGLNLLTTFQPDIVKLDMNLIRGLDADRTRRTVVRHTLAMLLDMGIEVIAEGIETADERDVLAEMGVRLMQGYLFSPPLLGALPAPRIAGPDDKSAAVA